MNNTKHTPGPWKVFGPFKGVFVIEQINSDADKAICETYEMANSEANARLIAAAPEMLAMLKDIRTQLMEGETFAVSDIETLIAKAHEEIF